MPTPTDDDLVALTGFAGGIANRLQEHETPLDALRAAQNVDIMPSGKLKRRAGYTLVEAGDWHSIWSDEAIGFGIGVKDDDLVQFGPGGAERVLVAGVGAAEVSCTLLAGKVYWSNGKQSGMVRVDTIAEDQAAYPLGLAWAVEQPAQPPTLAAYASGALAAGEYQVAVTFTAFDGREGGAGAASVVTLTAGQGVQLTSIPQPVQPTVTGVNVYISEPDGDVLHLVRTLAVGVTSLIVGVGVRGRQLETQWLQPMPSGHLIASGNARVLVATDRVLRWSDPMRGALTDLARQYMQFNARIDALVPVGQGEDLAGVYVSAGKRTYFLRGADPATWQNSIAFPDGAVLGTGIRVRAGLFGSDYQGFAAFFVSTDGAYCLGLPSGQVQPLSEGRYVTSVADSGRALVRRAAGLDQIIAVLRGTATNALAFSDAASAEVNDYGVSTDS